MVIRKQYDPMIGSRLMYKDMTKSCLLNKSMSFRIFSTKYTIAPIYPTRPKTPDTKSTTQHRDPLHLHVMRLRQTNGLGGENASCNPISGGSVQCQYPACLRTRVSASWWVRYPTSLANSANSRLVSIFNQHGETTRVCVRDVRVPIPLFNLFFFAIVRSLGQSTENMQPQEMR